MMEKKNVYFVQPNSRVGNSIYFPYAVGVLAAYSWQFSEVKENYKLCKLFYKKDLIEDIINEFKNPYLIGFSNYLWNCDYNLALAKRLKEIFPDCIMVFGGHHVPNNTSYLEKYSFVDILIHGEGEEALADILKKLNKGESLAETGNISFREKDGKIIKTAEKMVSLKDIPSPYLEGYFDDILKEKDENEQIDAIIETSRGCPYHCAYCDWGDLKSHTREMALERVYKEIEWLSKNKIVYCLCADANFGLFDRDEKIIDAVIEAKEKTGYPIKFEASFAKDKNDLIFDINKKLSDSGLSKGATIPFQSLSPAALESVGRKNLTLRDDLTKLMVRYRKAGITSYSDFILGFPGETYESFCKGLCEALEFGQHDTINVHRCELLPNSIMGQGDYVEKNGIKTISSVLCQNHCEKDEEDLVMAGRSCIIVETNTMSRKEWRDAYRFAVYIESFHSFGLLKCFAIYLHNEMNVSYYEFYSRLAKWLESESKVCGKIVDKVLNCIDRFLEGNGKLLYQNDLFGGIFWAFEEGLFLQVASEFDSFYGEIIDFVSSFNIKEDVLNELYEYQKNVVVLPTRKKITFESNYDFTEFFRQALLENNSPLEKKKNVITFCDKSIPENWEEFGRQIVWFGKRDNRTFFTGNKKNVTVEYK